MPSGGRCYSCNQVGHRYQERPAHVVNRSYDRGFGCANVAVASEFPGHENEHAALIERLELLELLQTSTLGPANNEPEQYTDYYQQPPSLQHYLQDARLQVVTPPPPNSTTYPHLCPPGRLFRS